MGQEISRALAGLGARAESCFAIGIRIRSVGLATPDLLQTRSRTYGIQPTNSS